MDSAAANAVLNRISNSVLAVACLMTMTNANREVCLSKVDSIMRQHEAIIRLETARHLAEAHCCGYFPGA